MKHVVGYSSFGVLCIGIFFFPVWLQIVLFFATLFLIDKKYILFIPALFSDILYMPQNTLFLPKALIATIVVLLCVMVINKTTRLKI